MLIHYFPFSIGPALSRRTRVLLACAVFLVVSCLLAMRAEAQERPGTIYRSLGEVGPDDYYEPWVEQTEPIETIDPFEHGHHCLHCQMGTHGCLWMQLDYLLWWSEGMNLPPLVTSSLVGTAPAVAGILGQPDTHLLVGDGRLEPGPQPGGRITLGWWCQPCIRGIQVSYVELGEQTSRLRASSDEIPILARPFINNQAEGAMLVAHPDFLRGSIAVDATSDFRAAEALWRRCLYTTGDRKLDLFLGYRYARLDESLRISQFAEWTAPQANIIQGTTQSLFDQFDVDNQFHGGVVGFGYERLLGSWLLEMLVKVGLGNNHAEVRIDGATTNTVPNAGSANFVGGLLAQTTNIGTYEQDEFSVIPELNVTFGRQLSQHVLLRIGYSLLYWDNVGRPSEQIDRVVSQFPPQPPAGTQQPRFQFIEGDYLLHGLHLGVDYRY